MNQIVKHRSALLEQMRKDWIWMSHDKWVWNINTIKSDHAVNLMKMLYNEVASRMNLPAVYKTPDGLCSGAHMTDARRVAIIFMLWDEIRTRTDLDRKYQQIFQELEKQLFELVNRTRYLTQARLELGL